MSFQLATATALPAEVQLGKEKPQGAFALRSRYSLSANSASSWNAGTTLTVPLQTGTPGTFTDVKQGVIQCTLQIINTNPYVDYLNFGPSGAMIFFDEMRIYSSGTPVEENLRYSETADLLTIQGGHQCRPFHIYRRNKWRAANGQAGAKHINFIKPSMVDSMGVPMFGRTPFMDKNSAVYAPPSVSFGVYTGGAAPDDPFESVDDNNTGFGTIQQDGVSFTDVGISELSRTGVLAPVAPLQFPHRNSAINQATAFSRTKFSLKNTQGYRAAPTPAYVAAAAHLPSASYVPSMWPDYQPATLCGEFDDDEVDSILGKAKVSEYMKYLCNVRSLPIGVSGMIAPGGNFYTSGQELQPQAAVQANNEGCRYLQYRVSMPFLSGIYGIFADKMFPDMLIGANNLRIEFKLASNVKAMWTTMDPCRRVLGTARDFIPFTGTKSGAIRGAAVNGRIPAASAALGCANTPVGFVVTAFSDYLTSMYSTDSALGEDATGIYGFTYMDTAGESVPISGYDATIPSYAQIDSKSHLPKPQYVPVKQPWTVKAVESQPVYVNENAACYGTYLPASQAQSRRCWPNTRLQAITDRFASSGTTTFSIRDIQYIGEQVQLDDVVTSAIIQSAAQSEIVVWTRGYRSFEASCDQNTQQNIILPIQIGQAEALFLLFRPTNIVNSMDYYSNSFNCPFVGLDYNTVEGADVGGTYTLNSSLDTSGSGAFSYQLFSGTKQYPLQPIQTVSELLTEREKSQHNLHNWDMCSTENMSLVSWSSRFGNASSATGLDFDPFMDFGYFTTFVPVLALDDQTITQNPYLQVAENVEDELADVGTRIRGTRVPTEISSSSTWKGVLNEFTSPIGSFYLGWDFESWTNHQDVMRTGKFLGQEQLSIRMTGTFLCSAKNVLAAGQIAQTQTIMCTAIVPHSVKLSFVPGGHMLSYY